MKRYILRLSITSLSILPVTLLTAKQVYAEEIAIGIYPQVVDITATAGQPITLDFSVINEANTAITVTPLFQPFKAKNSLGQISYTNEVPSFFNQMVVKVDGGRTNLIELSPGEEKTVTLEIPISIDSKSTDYYFSLIMMSRPHDAETNNSPNTISGYSSISGGVASHVILSLNPEPVRDIRLKEFKVPLFSQKSPVNFYLEVSSENNNYSRIHGKIVTKNIFGKIVDTLDIPETRILSKSTRVLQGKSNFISLDVVDNNQKDSKNISNTGLLNGNHLFPGIYRAELHLEAPGMSLPIKQTSYFSVAPIELIVVLIILIIGGFIIKSRIKSRQAE